MPNRRRNILEKPPLNKLAHLGIACTESEGTDHHFHQCRDCRASVLCYARTPAGCLAIVQSAEINHRIEERLKALGEDTWKVGLPNGKSEQYEKEAKELNTPS